MPRPATHELCSGTGQLPRHNGRTVVMRHAIGVPGVMAWHRMAWQSKSPSPQDTSLVADE